MGIDGRTSKQNIDSGLLEEIVRSLLDNDEGKLDDIASVAYEGNCAYVEITRRKGTKREGIVSYRRVEQKRLRAMTKEEKIEFNKLLKHGFTGFYEYGQRELAQLRRRDNYLVRLFGVLKANGYSVAKARVYHMASPFDLKVPVVVTKLQHTNGKNNLSQKYYVADNYGTYMKLK